MQSDPKRCGAQLADGTACQEPAQILGIQYVYDTVMNPEGSRHHNLRETRYKMACPKCGLQQHIEQADPS
jgi:hypothetical protein